MTVDNVREFSLIVENNTDIQKRLEATTELKDLVNLIVDLGSENSCMFTPEDVLEYNAEATREAQVRGTVALRGMPSLSLTNDSCSREEALARKLCLAMQKELRRNNHETSNSSPTNH